MSGTISATQAGGVTAYKPSPCCKEQIPCSKNCSSTKPTFQTNPCSSTHSRKQVERTAVLNGLVSGRDSATLAKCMMEARLACAAMATLSAMLHDMLTWGSLNSANKTILMRPAAQLFAIGCTETVNVPALCQHELPCLLLHPMAVQTWALKC